MTSPASSLQFSITFGAMVRSIRNTKGWTIQEFADKAGISRNYMSQIERNVRRSYTVDTLCKVARALEIDEIEFVTGYIGWLKGESIILSLERKTLDTNDEM